MQPTWQAMPDPDYFAHESIGSTDLKKIMESSVKHWLYEKKHPKPPTADQILGTNLHRIVAFPDDRKLLVKLPEYLDLKTKAGRAERDHWKAHAAATGSILVDEDDYADLLGMFESVMSHRVCRKAYEEGISEMAGFATDERGIPRKIKPDRRRTGLIFDLKTTQLYGAAPRNWRQHCFTFKYLLQAAYYLDTANLIEPETYTGFIWLAVEKSPPYAVCSHQIDDFHLELGRAQYNRTIDVLLNFKQTGKAIAYEEKIHLMSQENPDYRRD